MYSGWGAPTAALIHDEDAIVDYKLFWIACKDTQEAHYLLAIINSDALYEAVTPLMSKGQFGARDLQSSRFGNCPSPSSTRPTRSTSKLSDAGKAAAKGPARQLAALQAERSRVTVTIARRELRKWLRSSPQGQTVEHAVTRLLAAE